MATTFILSRKMFDAANGGVAAMNSGTGETSTTMGAKATLANVPAVNELTEGLSEPKTLEYLKKNLDRKLKKPVYQNLDDNKKIDEVNKSLDNINKNTRTKNINQSVRINKTTSISNPSNEKVKQMEAMTKMAKLQEQATGAKSVNEKLIALQKTDPIAPLSVNK